MTQDISAIVNTYNYERKAQAFRNKALTAMPLADVRWRDYLKVSNAVDFGYTTSPGVQGYTVHTDITRSDSKAYNDTLTVQHDEISDFYIDKKEVVQSPIDLENTMAPQMGFVLAQRVDQKLLKEGSDNAYKTITGGSVDASSVAGVFRDAKAKLRYQRVRPGADLLAYVSPDWANYIEANVASDGFNMADKTLANGYAGNYFGFKVHVTDNLYYTHNLTLDTNPTDGETITVYGVTFTFRATADEAGEVDIGASVAATQANLIAAINGTGTGDGTDYFEIELLDRRDLSNAQVSLGAFNGSDVAALTGYGFPDAETTMAGGNNAWATNATSHAIFGASKSVGLGMQIMPDLEVRKEDRNYDLNFMMRQVYGTKVFTRSKRDLVRVSYNA